VITRQLQVERGTGNVCWSKTGVLPLCNTSAICLTPSKQIS